MTEREMIQELENARRFSERNKVTVVAMGNGNEIEWFNQEETRGNQTMKDFFESKGYWTVSIFVDGHRVGA